MAKNRGHRAFFWYGSCGFSTMTASLNELLRATSRSFYLTLRVLPKAIRSQIGLAYLLARTADTIADTDVVPLNQRLEALQKLRERILDKNAGPLNLSELAGQQGAPEERRLLEKVGESLEALRAFSPEDQKTIRDVLGTITGGQELDLKRFASPESSVEKHMPEPPQVMALETAVELDDYTYRVAGCVGEFWSKICRAHLFPQARLDERQFMTDGIRFGKGLQLINILRDLPADLKKGRCYLPTEKLEPLKLSPQTMLSPVNERHFRELFHEYLGKAEGHLWAGWDYVNTLPFNQFRVRLACAWPILIGLETIEKLREANVIELQQGVKISRQEVRWILFRSIIACSFRKLWANLLPQKQLR
jgi:farnesyl-diphosphate farnesyltransferase